MLTVTYIISVTNVKPRGGRQMRRKAGLTGYCGVHEGVRRTGFSDTTLRAKADRGEIRSFRDPVGRRLLLIEDVEKIAKTRRDAPAETTTAR